MTFEPTAYIANCFSPLRPIYFYFLLFSIISMTVLGWCGKLSTFMWSVNLFALFWVTFSTITDHGPNCQLQCCMFPNYCSWFDDWSYCLALGLISGFLFWSMSWSEFLITSFALIILGITSFYIMVLKLWKYECVALCSGWGWGIGLSHSCTHI